jgi:2-polyprenyl-6-methoxyphenol hydroxylase-like FAD-dependent oxidoreductase
MTEASQSSPDVLISGAGPTGLMLAVLLAREGVPFRIFDRSESRAKESRALGVWPKSLELFQSVGLIDKVMEQGRAVHSASMYLNGRNLANISFSGIGRDDTPYPFIFMLAQSASEGILESALNEAGIKVEWRTTLESFEVDGSTVKGRLRHGDGTEEPVSARYLVGCDGASSEVRKLLNLDFKGGTYDAEFMLADANVTWDLPSDRVQIFLGNRSIGMFFPMRGGEIARIITLNQNSASQDEASGGHLATVGPLTLGEIQRNFQDAVKHDLTIQNPTWLTRYRVHHRSVERMQVGPVFLAGDAAHIHSPAGGQGMNTGLQDAGNLAWKLSAVIKGKAPATILATYNAERWPVGQKILNFSDRIFSVAISFGTFLSALRNFAILLMAKVVLANNFGRRRMFNFASQLNIHYHPNMAVESNLHSARDPHAAIAGRRAPDAPLAGGGSLFDLLEGYKFTLLAMSKAPLPKDRQTNFEQRWRSTTRLGSDAEIHWIDSERSPLAISRYQVENILISLVRPDGYIGFQTDHLDI